MNPATMTTTTMTTTRKKKKNSRERMHNDESLFCSFVCLFIYTQFSERKKENTHQQQQEENETGNVEHEDEACA